MNQKICASYMAPAHVEELYMVSNYSRTNQSFIEFKIEDVINDNKKKPYFMGVVLYPSQKNFGIILRNIKKSLDINSLDENKEEGESLALYYAVETVISCFVKEYSMKKENEFRTIAFDDFLSRPICVPIHHSSLKLSVLEDRNKYYQTVENIKIIT